MGLGGGAVEIEEKLVALLELAGESGLEIRSVGRFAQPAGESPPTSAVCRVRDSVWVVLSASDPPERQVAVLADALRRFRSEWLEGRFVAPVLRALLQEEPE